MADVGLFQVRSIYMSYPEWKNYEILELPGLPGITEFGVQQFFAMRSLLLFRIVSAPSFIFFFFVLFFSVVNLIWCVSCDPFTQQDKSYEAMKSMKSLYPGYPPQYICHMFFYEFKNSFNQILAAFDGRLGFATWSCQPLRGTQKTGCFL